MITLKVNGKEEKTDKDISILGFINSKKLNPGKIVIEHNLRIASKKDWEHIILNDNDQLEIISIVSGG